MTFQALDVFSIIFFLSGTFGVFSIRSIIKNECADSYRNMFSGLIVLSFFSFTKLLQINLLFNQLPFLQDQVFFNLVYWIGMITGMALLISGVSTWMPVFKNYKKYNSEKIKQLELFKKIEQLVRVENRINIILLSSLEKIVDHYNFKNGSCYIFSNRNKSMALLGSYSKTEEKVPEYTFDSLKLSEFDPQISIKPKSDICTSEGSQIIIPLRLQNKLLGTFIFSDTASLDSDVIDNLKIIADILTAKINSIKMSIYGNVTDDVARWESELIKEIDSDSGIKEKVKLIKNKLKSTIPIDYFSIYITSELYSGKITIHKNNQVLEEPRYAPENKDSLEQYVIDYELPVFVNNTAKEVDLVIDPLIMRSDLRSLVALPVSNENFKAVCIVACPDSNSYNSRNMQYLKPIVRALTKIIHNEINSKKLEVQTSRKSTARSYLKEISRGYDKLFYFHRSVNVIYNEFNPSFVRLSLFDKDPRFLNSQVLETESRHQHMTPSDATMMLNLMPVHQSVYKNKKTWVFDSIDMEQFTIDEQRQLYGKQLKWAMITPLLIDGKVIGVISLGDEKIKGDRGILQSDIDFIEDIAALTSAGAAVTTSQGNRITQKVYKEEQVLFEDMNQRARLNHVPVVTEVQNDTQEILTI